MTDDHSPVARLELRRDNRTIFSLRPVDGVCDSREETFRFSWPDPETATLTLRAVDMAGNKVEAQVERP